MKITILNGSPKGEQSITLYYVKYLRKIFPDDEYTVFNIGKEIKKIEADGEYYKKIIDAVQKSDAVVFSTPVFFLLVPSQLKRFIELVFENKDESAFNNKYGASITTSVKYFDHTAHNYLRAVSEDLGLNYVDGISADMEDLLKPEFRETFKKFWATFKRYVNDKIPVQKMFSLAAEKQNIYEPKNIIPESKSGNKKILLVTDAKEEDINLKRMNDVFIKLIPNEVEVIDINKADIKGGCLSCYNCAPENKCIYKDDFENINKKLLGADAVVFSAKIKDRYFSSRWKMFYDRLFLNGHSPVFAGKQFAYIISGALSGNPNITQVLQGLSESSLANISGIITDEYDNSDYITKLLGALGKNILSNIETVYIKPPSFLGVGGRLIFRDFVYRMGWFFRADSKYYKEHGLLDYPQDNFKERIQNFFMYALTSAPFIRKEFYKRSFEEMTKPYEKLISGK